MMLLGGAGGRYSAVRVARCGQLPWKIHIASPNAALLLPLAISTLLALALDLITFSRGFRYQLSVDLAATPDAQDCGLQAGVGMQSQSMGLSNA